MHIPLATALLAFLAFMLLPVLDRPASSEIYAKDPHSYLSRISRWMQQ